MKRLPVVESKVPTLYGSKELSMRRVFSKLALAVITLAAFQPLAHGQDLFAKLKAFNECIKGDGFLREGKLEEAVARYDRAIELYPKNEYPYYARGYARLILGELDKAIADYSRALAICPDYAEAYNDRGYAKVKQGDWQGALADYSKAIEIDAKCVSAYMNRGLLKLHLGKDREAQKDFERCLKLNPGMKKSLEQSLPVASV